MRYSYPIMIDLEYRLLGRQGAVTTGHGRTVRLSSTRVQFECADYLPEQSKVEISIAWPARLDDGVGLKLWLVGRTIPSPDHSTIVGIQRYEFRTRSERTRAIGFPSGTSRRASPLVVRPGKLLPGFAT